MDENLIAIINLSYALDTRACDFYSRLAQSFEDADLRKFWEQMAADEREHTEYWRELLETAQKDRIAQVFENELDLKKEIESLVQRVEKMDAENKRVREAEKAFLLAFQYELYLMHQALSLMLHFVGPFAVVRKPMEEYENHVLGLAQAYERWGQKSPAIMALSEALCCLWKQRKRMVYEAATDVHTGVLNRRALMRTVTTLCNLARRNRAEVGVLLVDVDHLRAINEQFGMEIGDAVLKAVTDCVRSRVRSSDVVGRYSGDEFMVFLATVSPDAVAAVADDIRRRIEADRTTPAPFTVSIGTAHGTPEGEVDKFLDDLIRRAEQRLYDAKRAGRNRTEATRA
jgi:diguanylate cyclase (GGDEF)-like protein